MFFGEDIRFLLNSNSFLSILFTAVHFGNNLLYH